MNTYNIHNLQGAFLCEVQAKTIRCPWCGKTHGLWCDYRCMYLADDDNRPLVEDCTNDDDK
jgi:hypothetical protein